MGKEIFFKKDLPTVLDNQQAAQPDNTSELEKILQEIYDNGAGIPRLERATDINIRGFADAVTAITNLIAQEANKAVVAELKTIVTFEGVVSKEIVLHKVMERITDRIALLTADKELNNG